MRRRDRDRVEQCARGGREPGGAGEHGVAHRLGDLLPRGEHLGDEEGIAARPLVQGGAVDTVCRCQARNAVRRERRERQPSVRRLRSEFPEHLPQRVKTAQLGLSIAHEERRRQRLHPSGDQSQ
jgi:hypothetical protein